MVPTLFEPLKFCCIPFLLSEVKSAILPIKIRISLAISAHPFTHRSHRQLEHRHLSLGVCPTNDMQSFRAPLSLGNSQKSHGARFYEFGKFQDSNYFSWKLENAEKLVDINFAQILRMSKITSKIPLGIWCQNEHVSTSMQRHHVASTLI